MRHWTSRVLWAAGGAALAILLFWGVQAALAQMPIPHATVVGDDCLSCHQSGAAGAPRVTWDHLGRRNDDCLLCHEMTGVSSTELPHSLDGRDNCLVCHSTGVGSSPRIASSHRDYTTDQCLQCHRKSTKPEPTPVPTPTPAPQPVPKPTGDSSCATCHQLLYADDRHSIFTGQPQGRAQAGASLYAQLCVSCHGEDGTTPVGDEDAVINAEAYWGTHDDAAILRDIGIGSHGQMAGFAQDYRGPLTWEQILDLVAFVRSWGPVAVPTSTPSAGGDAANGAQVYAKNCAACHGDGGQGGTVVAKPINTSEYLSGVMDDDLRKVILEGTAGMPGYAGSISDADVTDLIAFIRSWQGSEATPAAGSGGDATNGAQVYAKNCAACHGDGGQGGAVVAKPINTSEYLSGVTDDDLRKVILEGTAGMPGYAGSISDADVTDLIAFIHSWLK